MSRSGALPPVLRRALDAPGGTCYGHCRRAVRERTVSSGLPGIWRVRSCPGGLSSQDAHGRWHPDERQPPEPSLPRAFLTELASPLTPILAGGAALSASIGAVTDAVIIAGASALSALIGGVQRVSADRSMVRLFQASAVTARVLRDGAEQTLPAACLVTGDVVNDLFAVALDPNVFIQESKVATCDIRPGRRPQGPALLEYVAEYRRRAGVTPATGTRLDTVHPDSPPHVEQGPAPAKEAP